MTQDSLSLAGKVAIVTGSGKENGIGAGIALTLARAGAKVTINYVSDATAARAVEVIDKIESAAGKGSVVSVQADLSTPEGNKKIVNDTLKGLGVDHIDIIVNNAAWFSPGPALDTVPSNLERAFRIGVFGPLYLLQAAMPYMSKGGRVINIGSVASKIGLKQAPLYAALKATNDAFTFALAHELGRAGKGITINTVAPGPVMTDSLPEGNPDAEAMKEYLVAMTRAEGRPGTVQDVADVVLFLASEKSRWVTGQFISASGGITGG